MEHPRDRITLCNEIKANMEKAVIGKGEAIDMVLTALLCGGHVLIEDMPGLGKTTLAAALAKSLSCTFRRIQFTPDLLPSDVTGFTRFDLNTGEKEVQFGAVMSQIVLADEINRTSPKTQSSLLEAMQESQITIDGSTYRLPAPFLVLATQNPVEMTGTYPLPEAQLDRFLLKISLGYPTRQEEADILRRNRDENPLAALEPVAGAEDILTLQEACREVTYAPAILDYIVKIADSTRHSDQISLGVSPRGSLALLRASTAWAFLRGRSYVTPDDVQRMAVPVLAHRMIPDIRASMKKQTAAQLLKQLMDTIPVPNVS